jgi:hypothetical protein
MIWVPAGVSPRRAPGRAFQGGARALAPGQRRTQRAALIQRTAQFGTQSIFGVAVPVIAGPRWLLRSGPGS